jgi:transcriptional regulator with AAA-type ATPase domain
MVKDRIIEIGGTKRVLLPERCSGPSESYSVKELSAILASDRHSVLITGETGTGKEMLADVVMQMTQRPKGKCQRLNCAGLDSNLVGSELFGHKKGAFTGAEKDRDGLLKSCDGGVLFLDEIGWLLPDLQARLLRFMETGEIRPIGADKIEHHANVRIVAATNKDVTEALIHDLRARFDFEVNLPPLRDRVGDILWFLCEPGFLGSEQVFTGITLRTLVGILTNKWEGNIRELKKYCQRKVILNPIAEQDNECRHILENWHFGNYSTIESVKVFAGLALSAYESYGKMTETARVDEHARRDAALLAGLFCGMDGWLRSSDKPAVVPFDVLHAAANGELPECDDLI